MEKLAILTLILSSQVFAIAYTNKNSEVYACEISSSSPNIKNYITPYIFLNPRINHIMYIGDGTTKSIRISYIESETGTAKLFDTNMTSGSTIAGVCASGIISGSTDYTNDLMSLSNCTSSIIEGNIMKFSADYKISVPGEKEALLSGAMKFICTIS